MDEAKVSLFIDLVQGKPSLWNKTLQEYKNKLRKGQEWDKIASKLNVSKATAQKKWKLLVKKFTEEHTSVQFSRSGDGLDDKYESTWPYYESLKSLQNHVVANPSSSNLNYVDFDSELDKSSAVLANAKPSSIGKSSLDIVSSSHNFNMNRKHNDIAEQLLMMGNKKIALLEKQLISNPISNDTAEFDKLNMSFFETLLPAMREVNNQDTLLCRSDLTRVVFSYAYKNEAWKSLGDSVSQISRTPVTQRFSITQPKRRKLEDEDDCQIVSVFPAPPFESIYTSIKAEEKYRALPIERSRNRRRCLSPESTGTRLGPDHWGHASTPSNWPNQHYYSNSNNQQFSPQYPGQQNFLQSIPNNIYWQNHGTMTRQMASATITKNSMGSNTFHRDIADNATNGDDVHQLREIPVVTHQAPLTQLGSSQVLMEMENPTELSQNKKNQRKRSSAAAAQATKVLEANDLELTEEDTEI